MKVRKNRKSLLNIGIELLLEGSLEGKFSDLLVKPGFWLYFCGVVWSRSSMDRMTDSGSVGWAFESPRDHKQRQPVWRPLPIFPVLQAIF
jgi:hypothetical protein